MLLGDLGGFSIVFFTFDVFIFNIIRPSESRFFCLLDFKRNISVF